MVHAPTKDFVMTQLAHAYVIQDLREAVVKVNLILQYIVTLLKLQNISYVSVMANAKSGLG